MAGGVAILLLSTAAGYWVLVHASREKNDLKKIGRVLGLFIIGVSVVLAAGKLYCISKCWGYGGSMACPTGGKMMGKACPMPKGAPSSQQ